MKKSLDIISLEQLNELKANNLVVVHSKLSRRVIKRALELPEKLKTISDPHVLWDMLVGASINDQASEIDWDKVEKNWKNPGRERYVLSDADIRVLKQITTKISKSSIGYFDRVSFEKKGDKLVVSCFNGDKRVTHTTCNLSALFAGQYFNLQGFEARFK